VRRWKPKKGKLHAKCLIIDGSRVLTGSFNWTDSASESNVELLLFSDDALVAQEFQKIFERLWEEGKPLKEIEAGTAKVEGSQEALNEVIGSFDKVAKDEVNPGHLHN
jgi:phosphatidylserine/phosphatidylglycerophosphate/cardiolipin synthase-like enzyme